MSCKLSIAKHCVAIVARKFVQLERIHQWLMNPLKLKHPMKFLYATYYMHAVKANMTTLHLTMFSTL